MDRRRAAGVLLALAACFACSAAAPTASNQTALDLYEGAPEGCYYNFQHYGEGDRIMTNEPCLNCTCHNRMLMCYLRVCPFTKPIGQDCTVEKRADQCCPIVTCPDVPVDLLTSTSTTSPAEYGATGVGKVDKYGCSISGKYFPEGSKVPPTPNKPCEHCYCIRNMTTCVMQECTLHVDGCTPIYHKDVCCPVRYSCDHPEDEIPLLDDMSTTVRPTPGFLLTTTTVAPVTQMTQDCVHDDQIFSDGTSIKTEKPCEHCYCMKGDIVCVVQECGTPMENEGKNCTSLPPRDGQCCPDTYICEGDVPSTESFAESTTELGLEKLTTLSPPMRGGVEGSGYRNEPDEVPYTASPTESEIEGSGDDHDIPKPEVKEPMKSDKPTNIEDSASATETPLLEEHTTSTEFNKQIMEEGTDEPQLFTTVTPLKEDVEKLTTSELMEEEALQPHGHVSTTSDNSEESYERATTEYIEPLPTTSDVTDKQDSKPHEYGPSTVGDTKYEESENTEPQEDPNVKSTKSQYEYMTTEPSKPDSLTTIATYDTFDKTTRSPVETDNEADIGITSIPDAEVSSINKYADEVGSDDIEKDVYSTTSIPEQDIITTEDHAQNTVAVAEDESTHPYAHVPSTVAPLSENETETAMVEKESHEEVPTTAISIEDIGMITTEPDRGLNTIPNEINEESSEPSLVDKTIEVKSTESSLPESSTLVPDSLVTKGDQYTITTEPSFRKEDESSVSTHKPKDTSTVKPEFEDEGLIPTEEHSDKTITGSETPYEDITTSIPEYAGITETKQPSSESAMQPLDSSVTLPENIADVTPKPEDELTLSTEKITDITPTISEDVTTHEEPSRIPGEGDCLLDGITYKNNSIVPSTNKCHSSCRCTSSIIKCDPIICSPPPNYMGNCESIYDPLDSCCPTYVCDHPRETIPPQSDNQMSGTESPVPPPTIECRGDQCEIIPPEKHHDENICGPDGCGDDIQKPVAVEPSPEQPVECVGGQCRPSNVGCPNGDCSTVDAQETPVQLCTGEHCINDVSPEVPETSAPTIESTDCVGESCKQGDCGPNGCDSNVISNPEDAHIECSIDKPCRRKEPSPVADSAPCKGAECEKTSVNEVEEVTRHPESHETTEQSVKEITQSILDMTETPDQQQDISSEKKEQLPVSEMSTTLMPGTEQENTVPVEEIFTESYVTEHEDTQTESVIKEIVTEKPSDDEIEQTSDDKESTESPTIVAHQEHDINKPAVLEEQSTVNPVVEIENNEIKPIVTDKQEKDTPAVTDYNTTEKPNLLDEDQPSIAENDGQDPSSTSEKEGTENPLESTEESITIKPTAAYDVNEKESEISPEKDSTISTGEEFMQYSTKSPEEEKVNDESTEFEQVATDKTIVQEESTDTPTLNTDEGKEEPSNVEEKGTEKPISTDMYAPEEKPEETPSDTDKIEEPLKDINEETEIPTEKYEESERPTTISQESTEKSTLSGEDGQQIPIGNSEQAPDKATSIEEDSLLIPVDVKEKPTITPEDVMEGETEPPTDEAYNGTPTSVITEGEGTEGPINQPEDDKVKPSTADKEYPEKPTVIDEENKELTPVTEGAITEKTIVADDETKEPAEPSSTEKPNDVIPEENTITDDGHKLKPVDINVDITETPTDIEKEGTETTVVSEEENKLKPIEEGEEVTSKPSEVEEEKPISNEDDIKLTSIEQIETTTHGEREDFTKDDNELQPIDDHKESSRKPSIDEESTGKPAVTADAGEEKPSSYDSDTEKPIIVEVEYKPTEHAEDGTEQPTIGEIGTEKPMVSEDDNKIPMYESEITTETPTKSGVEGTEHPVIIGDENEIMPSDITDETTKIPTTSEVKDSEKPIDAKGEDEMKPTNVGTDRPTTVQEQPSFIDDTRRKEPSAIGDEDELTPVSLDEERTEGSISIEMEGTPKPDTEDESKLTPIGVSEEQSTEEPSNIVPSDEESKLKPSDAEDEVTEKPIVNEENNTATPNIIEDESHDKPFGTEGEGSEKPSVILDENIDKPTDVEEEPTEKPAVTDVKEPFDQKASTESSIAEDVNKDMPSGIEEGVKDKIEIPEEETKKPPTDYESSTEKPSEEESKEKPTGAEEEITVTPVTTEETNKPADVEEEGSPMIIDEDVNEKPAISSDDQIKYPDDIDSEKPDEVTTEPKPVGELQPEIQTEKYVPETLEEGSGMELQTPEHETVKPAESTETESQNETKPPYHEVSTKSSVETTSSELPAEEIVTSPASHQMEFESTTKFTETVETVTKSSESSEITEQEEPMAHTQIYESDSPSLSESGTTLMEPHEDNISTKSPVTESESGEIDRKTTSELPEQSLVTEKSPESFEDDLHSTGSPEVHDIESGITVTQVPIRTDEEEIKTDNTEAYIPEKESTESPVSSVTEPVRSFTEFKESSVTEQEQMVTEYPEKVTESQESAAIEKDNEITAIPPDTLGAETEKDVAEHFESHTTKMPVTEFQETSHTTTVPLEVYTNKEVAGTEIPLSHVTDSQNTQTKLEGLEITETPEIPTSGDEATVDDTHKSSTESVSLDDMQTELPNALITSEAPQSLITDHDIKQTEIPQEPESVTTKTEEGTRAPETYITEQEKIQTEDSAHVTEPAQSITSEQDEKLTKVPEDLPTESQYTVPSLHETQTEAVTSSLEVSTTLPERTTESLADEQATEVSSSQSDYSETTPYLIELEEHTHKMADESSTPSPFEEDHATTNPDRKQGDQVSDATTEKMSEIEVETKKPEVASSPIDHSTVGADAVTTVSSYKPEDTASASETEPQKSTSAPEVTSFTEKEAMEVEKEEPMYSTPKVTTAKQEEEPQAPVDDRFGKPEEKPSETSEILPPGTTAEVPKPGISDMQPTDEMPAPEEDGHFPPSGSSGYGEPDYAEEDQAFGPGTCRYGGKVYVSAQQIPRDDPCDFCFCFRSDIICLQQSCPPPIHGCHEEPIQGFCCPRYECPVSMATTVNVTTTTTTTTTTLPPHFPTHSYKGAAQRRGCQIKGHSYKVGEVVRSSSGPCLHCTCGGDGQMKCDPKACTPEPMLRQMIAAAVSAKRRR